MTVAWRHRAWAVAAVTFAVLVVAAAVRASSGVFLLPVSTEFGWSRDVVAAAITVHLLLYGLMAPFAAALMERFGIRPVAGTALVLLGLGTSTATLAHAPWQLILCWGVLVGTGAGCLALVFGAMLANRWFVTRRGLVTGLFSAAYATGQLLFMPTLARVTLTSGWRTASLAVAVSTLVVDRKSVV